MDKLSDILDQPLTDDFKVKDAALVGLGAYMSY